MTKDNATPRPWKVSDLDKCRIVADDNAGRYVAITHHDMLHNTEMNEANAQLIVKAVNQYDGLIEMVLQLNRHIDNEKLIKNELVEALNMFLLCSFDCKTEEVKRSMIMTARNMAKQALSQAEKT